MTMFFLCLSVCVGFQAGDEEGVVDSSLLGLGRAALMSKSTKPKVPENFNNLPTKPRLKALKQVCIDGRSSL